PSVAIDSVGKSKREKQLEDDIKQEPNEIRRKKMKEELDDLRRDRQREERRLEAERATAVELGKQRIEQRRLQGGSRFNIHFNAVPGTAQLTAVAVIKALSQCGAFPEVR